MDPTTARLILEWRIEDARQLEIARSAALGPYGHGAADAHEAIRFLEAELDGLNVAGSEDGKDPEERLARSPEGPQSDGSEVSEPFVDSQEYPDSASEAPKHADETQPHNKEVTSADQEEGNTPKPQNHECVSCASHFNSEEVYVAPCTHTYCHACIATIFTMSMEDLNQYPPRCCNDHIPFEAIKPILPPQLAVDFEAKQPELDTHPKDRTYCHRPACSTFLNATNAACIVEDTRDLLKCPICDVTTCIFSTLR